MRINYPKGCSKYIQRPNASFSCRGKECSSDYGQALAKEEVGEFGGA